MRRTILGLGVVTLGVACGVGSALPPPLPVTPERPTRQSDPQAEPMLRFAEMEVDFGEVTDEKKIDVEFPFVNAGDQPIRINRVEPACGCTAAELEKHVYQPGERGVIRATFDPEKRHGAQHKAVSVYSNDPNAALQRLMIKGYVRPIAYSSPGIVNFARVRKGEEASSTIEVIAEREGFEITKVETTRPELFEGEVIGTEIVEAGMKKSRQVSLRVDLKGAKKAGREEALLRLHTNDERRPVMTVQIIAMVTSDLVLGNPLVRVGRLSVGESFEHEATLRHTEHRLFEIVSVEHEGEAFDVDVRWAPVEGEAGTYAIRVRGEALLASRGFKDKLVITTSLEDESPIEMYFAGMVEDGVPGGDSPMSPARTPVGEAP